MPFTKVAPLALVLTATVTCFPAQAQAQRLRTENFQVTVIRNCANEGPICDDVSYVGTDFNSGEMIRLNGTTVHTICADESTPCHFIGYQFRNGQYRYLVTHEGTLEVYRGRVLLLQEQGTWETPE